MSRPLDPPSASGAAPSANLPATRPATRPAELLAEPPVILPEGAASSAAVKPGGDATPGFVAVIPARLASTRLPNKPLLDIAGLPMVIHVAHRAREAGASQVCIATDAASVAEVAREHGIEVILTSPDHSSGTDRAAEVARHFGWPDDTVVVNVQGDEPLIDPALVRGVAAHLSGEKCAGCQMATAAHPIYDPADIFNPNVVKVVLDAQGRALYFSRAPIPWSRDLWAPHWPQIEAMPAPGHAVLHHIGLYAYRAGFLRMFPELAVAPLEQIEMLEQLRALWHGHRIGVLMTSTAPAPGVDTTADLQRVRAILAR